MQKSSNIINLIVVLFIGVFVVSVFFEWPSIPKCETNENDAINVASEFCIKFDIPCGHIIAIEDTFISEDVRVKSIDFDGRNIQVSCLNNSRHVLMYEDHLGKKAANERANNTTLQQNDNFAIRNAVQSVKRLNIIDEYTKQFRLFDGLLINYISNDNESGILKIFFTRAGLPGIAGFNIEGDGSKLLHYINTNDFSATHSEQHPRLYSNEVVRKGILNSWEAIDGFLNKNKWANVKYAFSSIQLRSFEELINNRMYPEYTVYEVTFKRYQMDKANNDSKKRDSDIDENFLPNEIRTVIDAKKGDVLDIYKVTRRR